MTRAFTAARCQTHQCMESRVSESGVGVAACRLWLALSPRHTITTDSHPPARPVRAARCSGFALLLVAMRRRQETKKCLFGVRCVLLSLLVSRNLTQGDKDRRKHEERGEAREAGCVMLGI